MVTDQNSKWGLISKYMLNQQKAFAIIIGHCYLMLISSRSTSTHKSVKNNLLEAVSAKHDEYEEVHHCGDKIYLLDL
jgi:hypothetical protein